MFHLNLYCLFVLYLIFQKVNADEMFYSNIGDDMKIDLAEGGYKSVKLKCGSNSIQVSLETNDDFEGVIYTRGSFHDKKSPCFLNPENNRNKRAFTMKFPLDKCNTIKKGNIYSNVLVLQHDKELIMPGDAAFNLECDFAPKDITVNANLSNRSPVRSKISLSNADPSSRSKRSPIESPDSSVEITPEKAKLMKT